MRASQRKMSSSDTGPAVMPSGGEEVRVRYSWNRRREAREDAMIGDLRALSARVRGNWRP